MPYVTRDTKKLLDLGASPSNPGELNYKVTQEAIAYLMRQEKLSYATISATIASLSDASAELRRRLLDPYEDMKIAENGDVYPDALLDATDQIRQTLVVGAKFLAQPARQHRVQAQTPIDGGLPIAAEQPRLQCGP